MVRLNLLNKLSAIELFSDYFTKYKLDSKSICNLLVICIYLKRGKHCLLEILYLEGNIKMCVRCFQRVYLIYPEFILQENLFSM